MSAESVVPTPSAPGDAASTSPAFMGRPEEARSDLIEKTKAYRFLRQPRMAPAAEHRKIEGQEREALFRLGQAAVHWLWHEELRAKAKGE